MSGGIPPRDRSIDRGDQRSLDAEEARALRRRLQFWRSLTGLLILSILLSMLLFSVRRAGHRDRCRVALAHYGELARYMKLHESQTQMLMLQWQHLDQDQQSYPPTHYALLFANWSPTSGDEELPLAVCNSPHGVIFDEGRYVLYRLKDEWHVRWESESKARELAELARLAEVSLPMVK